MSCGRRVCHRRQQLQLLPARSSMSFRVLSRPLTLRNIRAQKFEMPDACVEQSCKKIGADFLSLFRPAVISELCAIVFRRRNLQSLQRPARQSIAPKIQSHCPYFCFGTNFRVRHLVHMSFLRRLKSSTKPEVHNVSQRRQSRRDQCMAIGNMRQFLVTLGHLVLEICSRTDRQA